MSLLSMGINFSPTVNKTNRAKLKMELEDYWKKSGLCGTLVTIKDILEDILLNTY